MTEKPTPANAQAETYCTFCGEYPTATRVVVMGPGCAICEDCVQLVSAIIEDEKERQRTKEK